jgi:hypothetical protein
MVAGALSLKELEAFDLMAPDRGGGERRFCCPRCGHSKPKDAAHRSLSVNRETGLWRCARCEEDGKLLEWWTDRREPGQVRRQHLTPRYEEVLLPAHAEPPENQAWREQLRELQPLLGSPGERYLTERRGVDVAAALAARVKYHPRFFGRPAVVFPLRDQAGNLVGLQGRYVDGGSPSMRTAGALRLGLFPTEGAWTAELVVVVEAPIDGLTLAGAGVSAVALCGTGCPAWLPSACAFKRVLLALDGDEAGDAAAVKLAGLLRPLGARVERLRPVAAKDWNEMAARLGEGPFAQALTAAIG